MYTYVCVEHVTPFASEKVHGEVIITGMEVRLELTTESCFSSATIALNNDIHVPREIQRKGQWYLAIRARPHRVRSNSSSPFVIESPWSWDSVMLNRIAITLASCGHISVVELSRYIPALGNQKTSLNFALSAVALAVQALARSV